MPLFIYEVVHLIVEIDDTFTDSSARRMLRLYIHQFGIAE